MKNTIIFPLISLCLFTLIACSKQESPIISEDSINPIRMEIEQVITEKGIVRIWATDIDCSTITSFGGTDDFEFMENFLRVRDRYFLYDSLTSFETDERESGNQMLLCFN